MPYSDMDKKRANQRAWYHRRRAEYLADKSCLHCGSTDDLHMHHRDPATKLGHSFWGWSRERREAEIAKCDVLCGPCHMEHHAEQRPPLRHGTHAAYSKLRCRCDACRAFRSEYDRQRRAKRSSTTTTESEAT